MNTKNEWIGKKEFDCRVTPNIKYLVLTDSQIRAILKAMKKDKRLTTILVLRKLSKTGFTCIGKVVQGNRIVPEWVAEKEVSK